MLFLRTQDLHGVAFIRFDYTERTVLPKYLKIYKLDTDLKIIHQNNYVRLVARMLKFAALSSTFKSVPHNYWVGKKVMCFLNR